MIMIKDGRDYQGNQEGNPLELLVYTIDPFTGL